MVIAGLMAILGVTSLAVDVGYLYVVRAQLQNAVDAAALAGAHGLLAQPGNYTSDGAAVRLAMEYAARNHADGQPVLLSSTEITFPRGNIILIDITRPARTFFARLFGLDRAQIRVRAAAVVAPAIGGTGGWRPWAPPDQFGHGGICVTPEDDDHGPFNPNPHTWRGVSVNGDYYKSPYDPEFQGQDLSLYRDCSPGSPTGFIAPRDVDGRYIELKSGSPEYPGNFYGLALGGRGADTYRDSIVYGWGGTVRIGDTLTTELGNMVGPTRQGVSELIARDPNAQLRRDPVTRQWYVWSDRYPPNESPRVVPIVLFDPTGPARGGRTTIRVANIGAFFIERSDGHSVFGRFIAMRLPGAIAGVPAGRPARDSSGASGYLVGTVQLADPDQY
jgi:hypothetical protein